jgi:hypothetical protein
MALEVTVGPPVLTINNGHTFLVSELDGSITPTSDQGLYSADTRYLSGHQLFINGKSWTLLNSGAMAYFADVFEVKAKRLTRLGHIESDWNGDRQELATRYANRDFEGSKTPHSAPTGPPFSATERFMSSTKKTSATPRAAHSQKTSK